MLSGFVLVCLLLVGVGVFGLSSLSAADDRMNGLYQDELLPIAYLGEVDADLRQSEGLVFRMATAHPDDRPGLLTEIQDTDAHARQGLRHLHRHGHDRPEKAGGGVRGRPDAVAAGAGQRLLPLAQAGRVEDLQTAVEIPGHDAVRRGGHQDTRARKDRAGERQAVLDDRSRPTPRAAI